MTILDNQPLWLLSLHICRIVRIHVTCSIVHRQQATGPRSWHSTQCDTNSERYSFSVSDSWSAIYSWTATSLKATSRGSPGPEKYWSPNRWQCPVKEWGSGEDTSCYLKVASQRDGAPSTQRAWQAAGRGRRARDWDVAGPIQSVGLPRWSRNMSTCVHCSFSVSDALASNKIRTSQPTCLWPSDEIASVHETWNTAYAHIFVNAPTLKLQ